MTNLETFRVVRRSNEWNRWGAAINVREELELETTDLEAAFRYQLENEERGSTWAAQAWGLRVVDAAGNQLFLDRLYQHVVGDELFQQQAADESFSINLDVWFRERLARAADGELLVDGELSAELLIGNCGPFVRVTVAGDAKPWEFSARGAAVRSPMRRRYTLARSIEFVRSRRPIVGVPSIPLAHVEALLGKAA